MKQHQEISFCYNLLAFSLISEGTTMTLNTDKSGNIVTITVEGDVITNDDFRYMKQEILQHIGTAGQIDLVMQGTDNISSAAVGFFLKVIFDDKKNIHIKTTTKNLHDTFKRLKLEDKLNVVKM